MGRVQKFTTKETSLARWSETPALLWFHSFSYLIPTIGMSDFEPEMVWSRHHLSRITVECHGNLSVKMVDDKCSYGFILPCRKTGDMELHLTKSYSTTYL